MNKILVISMMFVFFLFGCITNEDNVIDSKIEDNIIDSNLEEDKLDELNQKYAHNLFLDGEISLCKVFSNYELVDILDLKSNKITHERIRLDLEEMVTTSCTYSSIENEQIKISYASKGFSQDSTETLIDGVEKGEIEGYEYMYYTNEKFSSQTIKIFSGENIITLMVLGVEFNKENMIDLAKAFLSKVDLNAIESHKLQESSKTLSKYNGKYFTFDYPSNWETNIHYYETLEDKVALEDPDGMILFLIGTSDYGISHTGSNSEAEFKLYAENLAKESNATLLDYKYTKEYYMMVFEQKEIVSFSRIGKFGNKNSHLLGMYELYRYEFYEQDILDILDSIKPV